MPNHQSPDPLLHPEPPMPLAAANKPPVKLSVLLMPMLTSAPGWNRSSCQFILSSIDVTDDDGKLLGEIRGRVGGAVEVVVIRETGSYSWVFSARSIWEAVQDLNPEASAALGADFWIPVKPKEPTDAH